MLYGDGGGKVKAAVEPVAGAAAVARFMAEITRNRRALATSSARWWSSTASRDGILRDARGVWDVLAIDVVDGRIGAVRIVRNPDKLAHV